MVPCPPDALSRREPAIYEYLVKARQDDLLRATAKYRLAAAARRARATRRHLAIAAPARRLAGMRPRKLFS